MVLYAFHELTLEVQGAGPRLVRELGQLLQDFSWIRTPGIGGSPALCLHVHPNSDMRGVPSTARLVSEIDGLRGFEDTGAFYLTEGASLFHLPAAQGCAAAYLAPAFEEQSLLRRQGFWVWGLLKLLRQQDA